MNRISTRQKAGLVLSLVLNVPSIPSVLFAGPGDQVGPPLSVLVLDSLLAVIGTVAAVWAFRGNRVALRVVAGSLLLGALTTLPAFFVDVPPWIKLLTGAECLVALASLVLLFSPARRPVAVLD